MEIRLLRSFCVLAEEEHFNRAAQRLNLAQPSLTAQIKQLESDLDEKLFERNTRQVTLTDAGHILWEHAEQVLKQTQRARQAIQELRDLNRGSVTVGVVQTVKTCLAPQIVSTFLKQYPGITIDLKELSADQIESGIATGRLDFGIGFGPPKDGSIEWDSLFSEELVAVVNRDHPWSKRRFIRFEEFQDETLALLSSEFCTRRLFDSHAKATSISPRVVYETNSIESILLTLQAIDAVTFLPKLIENLPHIGDSLKTIRIKLARPEPIKRHVAILTSARKYESRASSAFRKEWINGTKKLPNPEG